MSRTPSFKNKSNTETYNLMNKQEKEIQQEIAKIAKEDLEVSSSIEGIRSITGVGLLTTVTVLADE